MKYYLSIYLSIAVMSVLTLSGCDESKKEIANNKNDKAQYYILRPLTNSEKLVKLEMEIKRLQKEFTKELNMKILEELREYDGPINDLYGVTGRKVAQIIYLGKDRLTEKCEISGDLLLCAILAKVLCPYTNEIFTLYLRWNLHEKENDCKKSEKYLEKVCMLGDDNTASEACDRRALLPIVSRMKKATTQSELTNIYIDGLKKSAAYLKKGCDLNNYEDCKQLYFIHKPGSKLYNEYQTKACNLGDGEACADKGAGLITGRNGRRDVIEGTMILEQCCNIKCKKYAYAACETLGQSYLKGVGVRKNLKRAVHFLGKACKLGNKESTCKLFHYYNELY